jgi:translation initiation factor 1A
MLRAIAGKGGKNRRRGKNENEEKRELIFKEDGQGKVFPW